MTTDREMGVNINIVMFRNCHRMEFNAHMNYSSSYTDIMLYTDAA